MCVPTTEAEDHVKKPMQRQNSLLNINRENTGPGRRGEETKSTSHWRMCSPPTDIFLSQGPGTMRAKYRSVEHDLGRLVVRRRVTGAF